MDDNFTFGFWGKSSEELLHSKFPMHRACRDGDLTALSDLLMSSAEDQQDLFTEDQFYGWTPAHWAAYYGKLDCLQKLVLAGISFDVATQRFNQTPTHVAAFGNQPHCLLWLLQNGTAVNARDYLGETAMHKAARSGSIECLNLLQSFGAIPSVLNNNGHTAVDLAMTCGHHQCAEYLQQTVNGSTCVPNGHLSNGHQSQVTTKHINGYEVQFNGQMDMDIPGNCANGFISRKRTMIELDENGSKKARIDNMTPEFNSACLFDLSDESMMTEPIISSNSEAMEQEQVPRPRPKPARWKYSLAPLQNTKNLSVPPAPPYTLNGSIPNKRDIPLDLKFNSDNDNMQVDGIESATPNGNQVTNSVHSTHENRSSPLSSMVEHEKSVEQAVGYESIMYESMYGGTPFCHAY